ncbi:MAG: hypothetical protein IH595_07205 [Bacteroidales bacterium]|nr:hypothetical protein [Bacteroidales bacterium]
MARIKNGILGGLSGKVGNVIGGHWNGIDYLRSVPTGVKQANTILQQSQRMKFKTVIEFLRPQATLVRLGFKPSSEKSSAFNAAMSYNFHNALTGDFESGFSIDYSKAALAKGNLPPIDGLVVESVESGKLNLTWSDNSQEAGAAEGDILYAGIYNSGKGAAVVRLNAAPRSAGSAVISLPKDYSGDVVHCYVGFFGVEALSGVPSLKAISTSVYAGPVTVM